VNGHQLFSTVVLLVAIPIDNFYNYYFNCNKSPSADSPYITTSSESDDDDDIIPAITHAVIFKCIGVHKYKRYQDTLSVAKKCLKMGKVCLVMQRKSDQVNMDCISQVGVGG